MIDRRTFTSMVAGTAAVGAGLPAAQANPAAPRAAEVRALRAFAERTHPRGWEAQRNAAWAARWDTLERRAADMSDGSYFAETRRALGWFADGHTTVLPFEFTGGIPEPMRPGPFGLSLPYRVRIFDDGAFIVATSEEANALSGARIVGVGGMSAADIVRAAARGWPGNPAWAHRWAGLPFSRPAFLEALGAVSDPAAAIRIEAQIGGRRIAKSIKPTRGPAPTLADLPRTTGRTDQAAKAAGTANFVLPLPEARALYLAIDEMADVEGKTFLDLTREAETAIARPEFARLIVDLRRNGGGNNFLGEPLRRIIAASRFNRAGSLYVLIGPRTFSAAQNLATRLERETRAIFVGEPTGGAPNHFGDAASFKGEATGLTSIVSTIPWFDSYPMDKRFWIMPDLPVPERFADWRDGQDPALDLALSHRPEGDVSEYARDRVFFYERKSRSAEWRPFWRSE